MWRGVRVKERKRKSSVNDRQRAPKLSADSVLGSFGSLKGEGEVGACGELSGFAGGGVYVGREDGAAARGEDY